MSARHRPQELAEPEVVEDHGDDLPDPDPTGDFQRLARLEQQVRDGYRGAEPLLMEHLAAMVDAGLDVDGTVVRTLVRMYRGGSLKVVTKGKRTDAKSDGLIRMLHAFGASDSEIADYLEQQTYLDVDPETIRKRRSRLP